jgi:hypothetical protein
MARDHDMKQQGLASAEMLKREEMARKSASEAAMHDNATEVADFAQSRTAKDVNALIQTMAPALEAVGEGLAKLGEGQQAQAQATNALAQAVMAETEMTSPSTGRTYRARKVPPTAVN